MPGNLIDFIKEKHGGNVSAFALSIEENPQTVHRWLNGEAIPRANSMARIVLATGGQVQPNDFYAEHIAKARARLMAGASRRALRAGRGA